ncbi:hypothetical protein BDV96DRAFT_603693 [Lophiotrema nucula]|uniref:Uncharacterized protein n=1 Tax=Lophiotrema nucula TaxID=690887 RepID=A0A6A5YTZ8_9PLEO|nr:hypothetical protein BDV96DRAFT_603693 [Lophiotrema nucula]
MRRGVVNRTTWALALGVWVALNRGRKFGGLCNAFYQLQEGLGLDLSQPGIPNSAISLPYRVSLGEKTVSTPRRGEEQRLRWRGTLTLRPRCCCTPQMNDEFPPLAKVSLYLYDGTFSSLQGLRSPSRYRLLRRKSHRRVLERRLSAPRKARKQQSPTKLGLYITANRILILIDYLSTRSIPPALRPTAFGQIAGAMGCFAERQGAKQVQSSSSTTPWPKTSTFFGRQLVIYKAEKRSTIAGYVVNAHRRR